MAQLFNIPKVPKLPDVTNMVAPAQTPATPAAPLGKEAARVGQPPMMPRRAPDPGVGTVFSGMATGVTPPPAPAPAPTPPTPVAPTAPDRTTAPAVSTGTAASTTTTPAPVDPTDATYEADSIKAAADEAAKKATIKAAADAATKAAEDKAAADKATADAAAAAAAAAANASGIPPVTPDTHPEVAKTLTAAQQTFDDLMAKAKEWMNATEDPASKAAFSKAIVDSALSNQAAMDAAKMQIASNPALAGQGAGNALLSLRASQLGMADADLRANLAISEQRAIQELNDKGFDAVYKLNELRKTDDEKNLSSYGSVLDEMIAGGATQDTLNAFFENNIKPLLPNQGAGLTLDMFRNPATRAQILSKSKDETQTLFRQAIARGDDMTSIQQLISAGWTDEQLTSIGKDWSKGKTLDEINQGLKDAGFEPVESEADLIGNEDLLGQASLINSAKGEINKAPYQDEVDSLLTNLTAAGYELTPDLEKQAKAWVISQNLPGADQSDLPPWKNDATAYLWDSWPLPGKSTFGNDTIDDTPSTHTLYERNAAIDSAWEKYVTANPDSNKRLSRADWYAAIAKDKPGIADGSTPASDITGVLDSWKPPAVKVKDGDRTLTADSIKNELAPLSGDALKAKLTDPDWLSQAISVGTIPPFTETNLPANNAEWTSYFRGAGAANSNGLFAINGTPYTVDRYGSGYVRNIGGIGDVVVVTNPTTGKRYVMKVGKPGKDRPIGYMVPIEDDGSFQWATGGTMRTI